MKQVLQNLRSGETQVHEVPAPAAGAGRVLVRTRRSLISAGTERMLVEFGRGSLLAKARAQPEKVRQVLDKIRADGLLPTLETVFARLDEPLPLGYCNAGVVVEVGAGVSGFEVGDRVVSNGPHADLVVVPPTLCARIPQSVSDEQAAFTVLGAIGLQGVRLLAPTLGESIVVTGLGLIGLMTVQLLAANGCRVLGIDLDERRLELARRFGAQTADASAGDALAAAEAFSGGRGVDGVLITASAPGSGIVHEAAQMCRKRGRIVLVGVVGLELRRGDFYAKELSFQVSCSYGPGRYDPDYEERGRDYPLGFVRWTEQRNFEAVLDLLASGRLDVGPLISDRIEIGQAEQAYRRITADRDALGVVLEYPDAPEPPARSIQLLRAAPDERAEPAGRVVAGVIGAGNFSKMTLLPALAKTAARIGYVADLNGSAAAHLARRFGAETATTDYRAMLDDPNVNLVFIVVRHDLHARFVIEALEAGKHVAVEKPLCLSVEQLDEIRRAHEGCPGRQLLVGFNRRFSPHAERMRSLLAGRSGPLCMSMVVNAGEVPADSWTQDPAVGGGRIVGEGCHWIDLMSFLADSPVRRVSAARVGESPGMAVRDDKMTITLELGDGSIGTLHYFGNGHKGYPKETLEVFGGGRVLRLDNFRVLRGWGWRGFSKMKLWRMDKGHRAEFARLVEAVAAGGPPVMPFGQIDNVTRATLAAVESVRTGGPIDIP